MKKNVKCIFSAVVTVAMLMNFPAISEAKTLAGGSAFIYNFESEEEYNTDVSNRFLSTTGNNTISYSAEGFGGSAGAMKVDVVNGGTTSVYLGNMTKGYYKFSAYVKPIDFTPAVDTFAFVFGNSSNAWKVLAPTNVGYAANTWTKVEAFYLIEADEQGGKIMLRLGDKNGNFANTVGSTGLTTYSYLIDDLMIERAEDEDSTVVYKRTFDTNQTFTDMGLNKTGGNITFETESGWEYGKYMLLDEGKEFKFSDKATGFNMKANRVYKATVWAKAADDAAVGKTLTFYEARRTSTSPNANIAITSSNTLTKNWQKFEFDGIRHYATNSATGRQTADFDSPTAIQLKIGDTSAACDVAIDEFTIYEYPVYYNGDFEKSDLSNLAIQGTYERETEDNNSYLKFTGGAGTQIISYPYIEPGKPYELKYKIRIDNYPKTRENNTDGFAENKSASIYAGMVLGYDAKNYDLQYQSIQSQTPIYQEGDEIGVWKEITQSFYAYGTKENVEATEETEAITYSPITPMAHFRVSQSIGNIQKTSVDFSVDDIEIIPLNVPKVSLLSCEGNVKVEEMVAFKWNNDVKGSRYIYRIYKESSDGWANIEAGTLAASASSVNYTIPETAGGKKLKFELSAIGADGRTVKCSYITTAVAEGEVSSVITLTNAENNAWLEESSLKGTVEVINSSIFPGTLFAALYEGGRFESMQLLTPTLNNMGVYEFGVNVGDNTDEIKVMHWDGFSTIRPYAAMKGVKYTE